MFLLRTRAHYFNLKARRRATLYGAHMEGRLTSLVIAFVFLAKIAASAEQLPGVTVESERQREQLRHDVDKFASSAISVSRGSDQVIARWAAQPICPMVAGLSRQAGEFILARISRIAKDAGAPLASEHCKGPNLFVIVPPDAEAFLTKLKSYRGAFNYEASKQQMQEFEKSRAVRVWFNEGTVNLDGEMIAGFLDTSGPRGKLKQGEHLIIQMPSQYGSRLNASLVTHDVISVIEIVDRKMVANLTIGQLADYVAMAGLTQFDLNKDFGNAPTVLNLFNAANDSKPAGITAWDTALLKALYKVDRSKKLAIADVEGQIFTSLSEPPR